MVELENLACLYGTPLDWFATWGTQLKSDTHEFGLENEVGLRDGEFQQRVQKIKAARARWKYYKKKPTTETARKQPRRDSVTMAGAGEAPLVEAPKPVAKFKRLATEQTRKARAEGIRLFRLAGKPTKKQFQLVYGERGHLMTWDQRAAAGVPAEKFQEALRAKQRAKQMAVGPPIEPPPS